MTLRELKLLLASRSQVAAGVLGPGSTRPCAESRVLLAISAALGDVDALFSDADRDAIMAWASEWGIDGDGVKSHTLHVRLTELEHCDLADRAKRAGLSISSYVKARVLQ